MGSIWMFNTLGLGESCLRRTRKLFLRVSRNKALQLLVCLRPGLAVTSFFPCRLQRIKDTGVTTQIKNIARCCLRLPVFRLPLFAKCEAVPNEICSTCLSKESMPFDPFVKSKPLLPSRSLSSRERQCSPRQSA